MVLSIPSWAKPLLTVGYSVSGFLITEIPVALNLLPATVDGYSTAFIGAGLGFVLSAAYYIHTHLQPYIVSTTTPAQVSGASAAVSSDPAASGVLSAIVGSGLSATAKFPFASTEGNTLGIKSKPVFTPSGDCYIASEQGAQVWIGKADGTGSIDVSLTYNDNASTVSGLADAISNESGKSLTLRAWDYGKSAYVGSVEIELA